MTNIYFLASPFPACELPEWHSTLMLVKVTNEVQLYIAFANKESDEELRSLFVASDAYVVSDAEFSPGLYRDFSRHQLLLLKTPADARRFWNERPNFPYEQFRAQYPVRHEG